MIFFPYNYFTLKFHRVKYDKFPEIYGFIKIVTRGKNNKIYIGKNVRFNCNKLSNMIGGPYGMTILVRDGGVLRIGNNVGISNSAIVCTKSITIEDNVLIGGGCKIWDTDFHSLNYKVRINEDNEKKSKAIYIDEGAFIGAYSIVLKGSTIGKRSIIGAGSVVSKKIKINEIWAGNPCRYIKSIDNNG